MATYPVKMLKDEEGKPFVPLISIDSIKEVGGETLEQQLDKKLETTNIIAGTQIALEVEGNNVIISNSAEGTKLINNLDQTTVGVGALDAAQGKVLKESIPEVINNLTTIDSKKALSAHQGYVLAGRSVPVGGGTGQVLMKSADDDYSLTWGDAADPNAIVGDGSIKKIVELTYDEYITLEEAGQLEDTTEYHISDMNDSKQSLLTEDEIQDMIKNKVSVNQTIKEKNLNDYNTTGFFYCNGCTNSPGSNGYLFAQSYGLEYCYQRYIIYQGGATYERFLVGGVWQQWYEVTSRGAWTNLEVIGGWSAYEGQNPPQIRRIGKHVQLRGLLLATAETNSRYAFVIPADMRPTIVNNLYYSVTVANNSSGGNKRAEMAQITTDGRLLTFGAYEEADWFGLEGISWFID